jgi:hypothetical protein
MNLDESTSSITETEARPSADPTGRPGLALVVSLTWLLAIMMCYSTFLSYEAKPAKTLPHPLRWPVDSALQRSNNQNCLVMFIHPKCPCTRASLTELSVLMTKCSKELKAYAVFLRPDGVEADWEKTAHWLRASQIPGVTVVCDRSGLEADRFGAFASGETLVYTSDGKLVFAGGITGARGHEGDNQGLYSIVGILKEGDMRCPSTGVFGCPLRSATGTGN